VVGGEGKHEFILSTSDNAIHGDKLVVRPRGVVAAAGRPAAKRNRGQL